MCILFHPLLPMPYVPLPSSSTRASKPHKSKIICDAFCLSPPLYSTVLLLGAGLVAEPCLEYVLRRPENNVVIGTASNQAIRYRCEFEY